MQFHSQSFRGCLLGLAVGDAMGYPVDAMCLAQIQEHYGPKGLQGYDLVNGYADVTSYTQLAAFTCNGLLLGLTRGQMMGKMAPFVKYVGLSSREWVASQRPWGRPDHTFCWLIHQNEICRRHAMDTRMMDTLSRQNLGTMDTPTNHFAGPGNLTSAVSAGLFGARIGMEQSEIDLLGAEVVALSHGSPLAFLSGAALAHMVSRSLIQPEIPFRELVMETIKVLKEQFGHQYTQAFDLSNLLHMALSLADDITRRPIQTMEYLKCDDAAQVLAGAVYAIIAGDEDFDRCMVIAINHSGRSSAVGAVVGAILGLRQTEDALPPFYMECLEPAEILMELADDLYTGCSMTMGSRLFDLDWDHKYVHGGN